MYIKNTDSKDIQELFSRLYLIPNYQRPYMWNTEETTKLWEDIIEAFTDNPKSEYFLGTIVLVKHDNEKRWEIVDGQQRLTTLLLFIRAFCDLNQNDNELYTILSTKNVINGESKARLVSEVIHPDSGSLMSILKNTSNLEDKDKNTRFYKNYKLLLDKIKEWHTEPNSLIEFFLEKIKILCIECSDQESALTIFQTLNNRGLPLNDTDILKAKLYGFFSKKEDQDIFIEEWSQLKEENREFLFRTYLYILRAVNKDKGNVPKLRTFFEKHITKDNYAKVFEDIKKIALFSEFSDSELDFWKNNTLEIFPVDLVKYPYYIFMYKNATITNEVVSLTKEATENLITLIKNVIKFSYCKGVIYKSINSIKKEMFDAYITIYQDNNLNPFSDCLDEQRKFEKSCSELYYGSRYMRSTLSLFHILNPKQPNINISAYEIEHILPQKYQGECDEWKKEDHKEYVNKLGNLTLLKKSENSKAGNNFLTVKKDVYKISKITDVSDQQNQDPKYKGLVTYDEWTKGKQESRMENMIFRLSDFIFN